MSIVTRWRKVMHAVRATRDVARNLPAMYRGMLPVMEKHAMFRRLCDRYQCRIHDDALLRVDDERDIVLSAGVIIGAFTYICILNFDGSKKNSSLRVGRDSHILEQNNIRASGGSITIGCKCLISQQVSIIASNHCCRVGIPIQEQGWDETKTGVAIGDDVWIGCGVQILPGSQIGSGAIVAAGSVVRGAVAENAVVGGIPARTIRQRV